MDWLIWSYTLEQTLVRLLERGYKNSLWYVCKLFSAYFYVVLDLGQPSNQQEVDAGNRCVGVGVSPPCMLPGFDRDVVNMGFWRTSTGTWWWYRDGCSLEISHLFFECPSNNLVWCKILLRLNLSTALHNIASINFNQFVGLMASGRVLMERFSVIWFTCIWVIWKGRN